MSDPMAEIRASFFIEAEELLESLQDGLNTIYDEGCDDETINVVFRAVHSIKGGAGAFALDQLVAFAHTFETALDEVRAHRLEADAKAVKLFFQCTDRLSDLVRSARDGEDLPESELTPLLDQLRELSGVEEEEEADETDFQPMALDMDLGTTLDLDDVSIPSAASDDPDESNSDGASWKISFAPHAELFASGNEPIYILRSLRDMGGVASQCRLSTPLPSLAEMDPEGAYLAWDIELQCDEDESAILEAFSFVEGLCTLSISREKRLPSAPQEIKEPSQADPITSASAPPTPVEQEVPNSLEEPDDQATVQQSSEITEHPFATSPAATQRSDKPKVDLSRLRGTLREAVGDTTSTGTTPVVPKATVRVDLERIDRLVNLVGELVINQAMLSQAASESKLATNGAMTSGLDEFLQLTRDIQESVMMIRAQPVKSLFQRMSRIVREASDAVGKDVRLRTEGENTEIDKTVIERLADPLTHMIRNAVDHGLEKTEERVKNGKPSEGIVTLTAAHKSGRVIIELSDDGAGINRDRVKSIAIDKGLIPEDAQLSDAEIDNLLFLPGFSTASEISNLSGRGVGMDVVKSSITALGGRVSITSTAGEGTTFSISLPLTLAILDGMIVEAAGETLVVPLNAIIETMALSSGDLRSIGPGAKVIEARDSIIPIHDLGTELAYRSPKQDYTGDVALLLSNGDVGTTALIVDRIIDQRQVVIKGLQEAYGQVPGIAAATILGDGQIALILDPVDLIDNATGQGKSSPIIKSQIG